MGRTEPASNTKITLSIAQNIRYLFNLFLGQFNFKIDFCLTRLFILCSILQLNTFIVKMYDKIEILLSKVLFLFATFFSFQNGSETKRLENVSQTFVEFTHKLDPGKNVNYY